MNRYESLKEKLREQRAVLGTTIANVRWSGLVQKVASFPFDFMVFDLEHGTLGIESVEESLRVCRLCGLPSLVRVGDCVPNLISKTLDMGADGLILPRIESVAQVETAIRAARYFPRGRKGCGGFSNLRPDDGMDVSAYNGNRLLLVQMESLEGLAVLPELIARFRGEIAGVVIGPYDASIMVGTPLKITSDVMTGFIGDVFRICRSEKMSCGSFVDDASMIARYRGLGANIFWTGTELSLISEAYGHLCSVFAAEAGGAT